MHEAIHAVTAMHGRASGVISRPTHLTSSSRVLEPCGLTLKTALVLRRTFFLPSGPGRVVDMQQSQPFARSVRHDIAGRHPDVPVPRKCSSRSDIASVRRYALDCPETIAGF